MSNVVKNALPMSSTDTNSGASLNTSQKTASSSSINTGLTSSLSSLLSPSAQDTSKNSLTEVSPPLLLSNDRNENIFNIINNEISSTNIIYGNISSSCANKAGEVGGIFVEEENENGQIFSSKSKDIPNSITSNLQENVKPMEKSLAEVNFFFA